jgi:hypothetical protein
MFLFRMPGLSSGAQLVFVKPAFGRLSFLIKHMLGACVLCLALACHHAFCFGSVCLTWSQLVSFGFRCTRFDSLACFFSGAWLSIGCSACIWKACLRQAFFFNETRVGCLCPLSGSGLTSGIFTRIRFVSLGLSWSHLDSDAPAWIHYHVSFSDAWLSIGCSACIWKACLRQAFFFNKTRVGRCVLCLGLA